MNGEFIVQNAGNENGSKVQCIYSNINMKTSLASPWITGLSNQYLILANADYSSLNVCMIKDSSFETTHLTAYFACHRISQMGFSKVAINGIPTTSRFIHSEGSTIPQHLALNDVTADSGQNPIDLSTLLQYIDQSATIASSITNMGVQALSGGVLYASAAPTYPPANKWSQYIMIEKINKTAGGYTSWSVVDNTTTPVWKQNTTIAP
jgi:hypothetical protein